MADPPTDSHDGSSGDGPRSLSQRRAEPDRDAPRPVGLALLVSVGFVMATLVAGLVWSTGRGLRWW